MSHLQSTFDYHEGVDIRSTQRRPRVLVNLVEGLVFTEGDPQSHRPAGVSVWSLHILKRIEGDSSDGIKDVLSYSFPRSFASFALHSSLLFIVYLDF